MRLIISILCIVLLSGQSAFCQQKTVSQSGIGRYVIYMSEEGNEKILLDTKTGITWRNIKCKSINGKVQNENEEELNCWKKMDYFGYTPKP